jgi:hypothetical protein
MLQFYLKNIPVAFFSPLCASTKHCQKAQCTKSQRAKTLSWEK